MKTCLLLALVWLPKKYLLWFLWIPLGAIIGICLPTGDDASHWPAVISVVCCILAIPVLINLFFGPTIYAFWRAQAIA
jgi:hypothetical protein